eukprot:snap_masked-scaffold_31-processed-gene-1.26-mRNA-1 protein AED:0.28 eAED:0.29 QI:0/-1/0/1/-1/1/1/0/227
MTYDAVFILGGGAPSSIVEPPQWVQERCKVALELAKDETFDILCLSGGSAHARQTIRNNGLPLFESQATASFLLDRLPETFQGKVYFETSSYDTIGNAYFARTAFGDVFNWNKICVITSSWHMKRTKLIFETVFSLNNSIGKASKYDFTFLEAPEIFLGKEEVIARNNREENSIHNFQKLLRENKFPSLKEFSLWLFTEHKMYSSQFLDFDNETVDEEVSRSYSAVN